MSLLLQALEQHKGPGSASWAWKATGIKFAETFPSVSAPVNSHGTLLSLLHCLRHTSEVAAQESSFAECWQRLNAALCMKAWLSWLHNSQRGMPYQFMLLLQFERDNEKVQQKLLEQFGLDLSI